MSPQLTAAIEYASRGWSSIALCTFDHSGMIPGHTSRCNSPGKVPLGSWNEYQTRIATTEELEQKWARVPHANVGVVCGAVSNLVALDVDSYKGDEILIDLSGGELTQTQSFNTGKDDSFRLLFKLPEGHPCPTIPFRMKDNTEPLKILGNGSQTVMPPSTHPNGCKYQWIHGRSPNEIEIAEAPLWLLALLKQRSANNKLRNEQVNNGQTRLPHIDGEPIKKNGRNSAMTSIAGAVRRYGCTQSEIYSLLDKVNLRCDPPLDNTELAKIAKSISRYAPTEVPSTNTLVSKPRNIAMSMATEMSAVMQKKLEWLWPKWLPLGTLLCIDGDGGVGKSTMLIDLAARITRGDCLPDGSRPTAFNGPQSCLMIACEDGLEDVIKARCTAARADQTRLFYMDSVMDRGQTTERQIELPTDIEVIEAVIKQHQIRFMFIDPILAFLGAGNDYASDQDVRKTLTPLKKIAEKYGCCIAYLRHLNKGSVGSKASYRGGGSLAFVNAARTAWFVGRNPENEDTSILAIAKGNLTRQKQSWCFETKPVSGLDGICWIDWLRTTNLSADDVNAAGVGDGKSGMIEAAKESLIEMLINGPKSSASCLKQGMADGFTKGQMQLARRAIGAIVSRTPGGLADSKTWTLPPHLAFPKTPQEEFDVGEYITRGEKETSPQENAGSITDAPPHAPDL